MTDDPSVTFGPGGIDRAAHLRGDAAALAAAFAGADALCLPVWRGRPLLSPEGAGFLPATHPLCAGAAEPMFLGLVAGRPHFAIDMSGWEPAPEEQPLPQVFYDASEQHHPLAGPDRRFADLRGAMARLPAAEAELVATAKALAAWHDSHRFCARCGQPSRMATGGWQRTCPACKAVHFPRTDPVVIMLVTRGNRVLLGRSPGWPEGMYSLLAGFMEPGETLESAVRREVFEETAIRVGPVRYMASQPWPFPASLMLGCRATATSEDIRLDHDELDDALWLSREELAQVLAGLHPRVRQPRKGAIARYLMSEWLADTPRSRP
jgi:NAD+ diphosphatase